MKLRCVSPGGTGDLFMAGLGSEEKITSCVLPDKVHCLPSGRILICGHARDGLFLRNVDTNKWIELKGVWEFGGQIVEIPSGLVTKVVKHDGSHGLGVIHESQDSVPDILEITKDGNVSNLRRWGDYLVFQTGDRLRVISVEEIEYYLDDVGGDNVEDVYLSESYPLYTPFDRLVHTEEGILSWHFVNGTFYIIRYPLPE